MSDEELDKGVKHIKLIKGPYRHGGEGYKYYDLNFKIGENTTDISAVRYDASLDAVTPTGKVKHAAEDIEDKVMRYLDEQKLNRDGFNSSDVQNLLDNTYGYAASYVERKIRAILKVMADRGDLCRTSRGYKYLGF